MSKSFVKIIGAILVVYIAVAAILFNESVSKREFEQSLKSRALQVVTNVGRGSAIYLDKGLAMSAAHVCELFPKAKEAYLVDAHNAKMRIEFYELPKYNQNKRVDLCLMKFKPLNQYPVTELSSEASIATGTSLYNPNYGGGKYYSLQTGQVLSDMTLDVPTEFCMPPFIPCEKFEVYSVQRTSVPGIPGASGSGILDTKGKLVGILVIGAGDNSWSGIVPIEVIREFLNVSGLAELAQINKK